MGERSACRGVGEGGGVRRIGRGYMVYTEGEKKEWVRLLERSIANFGFKFEGWREVAAQHMLTD